jgi:hypothetical protein
MMIGDEIGVCTVKVRFALLCNQRRRDGRMWASCGFNSEKRRTFTGERREQQAELRKV